MEQRYGRHVDRLLLYWTAEPQKEDALMVLPYYPGRVDEAGQHFDEVVGLITAKEFTVKRAPESGICKECDVRLVCHAEGVIAMAED